jgi:hypothetical protein
MSTHDYGSTPDQPGDGYGYPPGHDPAAQGGYADGYGEYQQAPYDPAQSYGYGGTYGPEPTGGQPPQDPAAYGTPPGGTWSGQQSWQAAPAGTWEQPGAEGYGYGAQQQPPPQQAYGTQQPQFQPEPYGTPEYQTPYQPQQPQPQPQAQTPPHAYADQQPYAQGGIEHTAILPVIDEQAAPPDQRPQAPVRTGSPIIPPGIQPAGLTAALGLLLAGGAAVGKPGLAVVLVLLQAVTAAGWFRLNGMWPARQGIMLAFLGGVTADAVLLAVDGGHGPLALAGTLGVWLLLVLVLQLRHHGSADERLSSLTATSASTLLAVLAACYLATATSHAGTDPVVVGVIAVAAATVIRALPLPGGEPVSLVLALAAATATALVTGPATGFGGAHAALLAVVCGACALIGLRVASYDFPSRFVHFTAGVALPLTAAAPLVYILGRALS